ncbi:MAG: triose-phosphate isomerase [Candidatus Omnitrophica bacterium]|nr:triose-phosphate isomerase [Candidatus Omnitrophota bacterium]
MNGTLQETALLCQSVLRSLKEQQEVEVVLCPPFTALVTAAELLKGSRILLGAQDAHWEPKGAYTGEVAVPMLKEIGCRYCIVGHSERRQILGETDEMIHQKVRAVLEQGLSAILCVGETLEIRRKGGTLSRVEGQLGAALQGIEPTRLASRLVIAYEPVWAIGTGHNATPAQAQEVHRAIRSWLSARIGKAAAESVRIQYGGSVKPENAGELMAQPDVDGALVGGASLEPKGFVSIVESTHQAKRSSPCSTGLS